MRKLFRTQSQKPDGEFLAKEEEKEEEKEGKKVSKLKSKIPLPEQFFSKLKVNVVGELIFGEKNNFEYYVFVAKISGKQYLFLDLCLMKDDLDCTFVDLKITAFHLKFIFSKTTIDIPYQYGNVKLESSGETKFKNVKSDILHEINVLRVQLPINFNKIAEDGNEYDKHQFDPDVLNTLQELNLLRKEDFKALEERDKHYPDAMPSINKAALELIPSLQNSKIDNFYDLNLEIQEIPEAKMPNKKKDTIEKSLPTPETDLKEEKLEEIKIIIKIHEKLEELFRKSKDWKVVSFTGLYNKGKTFILSSLFADPKEMKPDQGFDQITKGLCIKADYDNKILYIDSEGFERAVTKALYSSNANSINNDFELRLRAIREKIYQQFILEYLNVIIIVLSQLTHSDQKLMERIKNWPKIEKKQVMLIHNFHNLASVADVQEKIKKLSNIFNFDEEQIPDFLLEDKKLNIEKINREYFIEKFVLNQNKTLLIQHLIFAKEGTGAGNFYNKSSIEFLKNVIHTEKDQKIKIIDKFIYFANDIIKQHFKNSNNESIIINPEQTKKGQKDEFCIKVASTKPEISPPNFISVNRIVMTFLGEIESLDNCKPHFELDIPKKDDDDGKFFHGKIKMQFPFNKNFYELVNQGEKNDSLMKQNSETNDIEFYFCLTKKKYGVKKEDLKADELEIFLDKTTSGLSRFKYIVQNGIENGKIIRLVKSEPQEIQITQEGILNYDYTYLYLDDEE